MSYCVLLWMQYSEARRLYGDSVGGSSDDKIKPENCRYSYLKQLTFMRENYILYKVVTQTK